MKIAHLRKEYGEQELRCAMLAADPCQQFDCWLQEALAAQIAEPTAMVLASLAANGQLHQRTVLLKGYSEQGFLFFTNYQSQKAMDMEKHPQASLHFLWLGLQRQVQISGSVAMVSRDESKVYFQSRPRGSQLAAWASKQSRPLGSREELDQKFQQVEARFAGRDVPLPDFWGGYCLKPERFEFWQGGAARLHDRFCYEREDDHWTLERLAP